METAQPPLEPSRSPAPGDLKLTALWQSGRSAHPGLHVPIESFRRYVTRIARDGSLPSSERAGDLYLACGCALRLPRALDAFESLLASTVGRAIARIDGSPSFVDVVTQDLRSRLLVGEPPKILDYAGLSPLGSWLKVSAVRTAISLRRAKGNQPHDPIPCDLVANSAPEQELVRARYRAEFEDALRVAIAALPDRDRALLRANLGDGRSIDALAELHGVGRSTAARWLSAARERLTRETRRVLLARLEVTPSELDSLAAALRSELHVSIVRLLGLES